MEDNSFEIKIRQVKKMARNYFVKIMAWNATQVQDIQCSE